MRRSSFHRTACLTLVTLLALSACEPEPVPTPVAGGAPDMVRCSEPQPEATVADTLTADEPLVLTVGRGHSLTIPPGAAPAGTVFTLQQLPSDTVMIRATASGFQEGQQFNGDVALVINYAGCADPAQAQNLQIWRLTDGEWELVGGEPANGVRALPEVGVRLRRLSDYAIGSIN